MHTAERLGLVIREERAGLGWSVAELADKAGVPTETLAALETGSGRATVGQAWDVLDALGVYPLALPGTLDPIAGTP
jgi:transcriptional regulator with XRE-family HTH domain